MKKQMKSSLFAVAMGLSLTGTMLSSSSDEAMHAPTLQEQAVATPETASVVAEAPHIPITAYLTLVTAFTNGTSIDFNAMDAEGQSFIWDKMTKWREEQ